MFSYVRLIEIHVRGHMTNCWCSSVPLSSLEPWQHLEASDLKTVAFMGSITLNCPRGSLAWDWAEKRWRGQGYHWGEFGPQQASWASRAQLDLQGCWARGLARIEAKPLKSSEHVYTIKFSFQEYSMLCDTYGLDKSKAKSCPVQPEDAVKF